MSVPPQALTFQQFVNAIPQLVWSASPDGIPFYANKRCIEFTGYDVTAKQNQGWTESIHPEDRERVYDRWTEAMAKGLVFEAEYRIRNHAGEHRWFLGRAVPVRDPQGAILYWFGTGTDIHRQKELEIELKAAKDAADNANSAKSVFLANMSHEIRTPLAAVLGFAQLLADPQISTEERARCLHAMQKNSEQLSGLIDEILDLSRVESQKLELHPTPVSPRLLTADVIDSIRPQARQKALQLAIRQSTPLPDVVLADTQRLRQILINLIGNAVKFTEKGEIQVDISAVRESGCFRLQFRIRDSGPGISAHEQAKLFHAFTQGDASKKRSSCGSGLGLALSKRLAEAMGGTVRIESSEPGRGSVFLATILVEEFQPKPAESRPLFDQGKAEDAGRTPQLCDKKILVVDDSEDNRFLVSWILKKSGAQIDCAEDGPQALEMMGQSNYDAVLMDIQMPQMDGFTACGLVRERGFKGPMIAITAHAMESDRERCLQSGFDEHLTKPLNPRKLQSTLQQMLLS